MRKSEAEKQTHARKLNMARRHLTSEQKRVLIRDQLKATPEQSDRQIAKALGVNHETVGTQRKELEADGGIRQCSRQASDGRVFHKPVVSVFNPTKREERAMKKPEVIERMHLAGMARYKYSSDRNKMRCVAFTWLTFSENFSEKAEFPVPVKRVWHYTEFNCSYFV